MIKYITGLISQKPHLSTHAGVSSGAKRQMLICFHFHPVLSIRAAKALARLFIVARQCDKCKNQTSRAGKIVCQTKRMFCLLRLVILRLIRFKHSFTFVLLFITLTKNHNTSRLQLYLYIRNVVLLRSVHPLCFNG